jgi:toxin HigB-1
MIASFRHKGLRRFFETGDRSKLAAEMVDRIEYILGVLNVASSLDQIKRIESLRLHALKGDRQGLWAVTVRANWRITFRMKGDVVNDVDFLDYH